MTAIQLHLSDVPADLVPYAVQQPATDLFDLSLGIQSIVVLRCPHCRDAWCLHWVGAKKSFRDHLQGSSCRGRGAGIAPSTTASKGGLKPSSPRSR